MHEAERLVGRRAILGTLAGGLAGVTGCAGVLGGDQPGTVSVLSAGSLAVAFNERVGPAFEDETEYGYRGEFHGSNAVMRMVESGQKQPDVVVSADASLLRETLEPSIAVWDVVFASNALVITYNDETDLGNRLESGDPWYQALRETDATVARSDPDLDPLGYRTVQLFKLAEEYYDEPGLTEPLLENLVVDPEEAHLLAAVETGDRAAAVAYKNMATDHDLPYLTLPPELNFSDPALRDYYASVSYTTDQGERIDGTPVLYNVTVPKDAPNPDVGRAFVEFLLANPDILRESGLVVSESHPQAHGEVPSEVLP